ncbi:MAG: hydrogen peroxide-dependent heme synthase [Verrucomicrobiota bacterium]|nr:hydrogen peroxide-dependent heme synthase [Verrucomicrobiota bacterium]
MSNNDPESAPIVPTEGWHVIHLFYQIDHTQWSILSEEEQLKAKTDLSILVQEIRSTPKTQLLAFSIVTPKADIGFMLLTDDLHLANGFEKQLTLALGADILTPSFSYLSMTETGDYMTTEEEYSENTLKAERKLTEGSDEYETALNDFKTHMAKYSNDKLYPNMPDWPVFCFYSMAKRRGETYNWYALPFDERKRLMAEHGKVGRQWAGKIRQLITGSVGLDDSEWGVTLFANNSYDIKGIVYRMRYDEVSVKYAEFGDFYIGLQLPLDQLFRRVGL